MRIKQTSSGDTLIEVMFAIAVFAFVAAGSLAIMRQGISTSEKSLQITLTRQAMNNQAELLRFIQTEAQQSPSSSKYAALWSRLTDPSNRNTLVNTKATPYGDCAPTANSNFILNPDVIDPASVSNPSINTVLQPKFQDPNAPPYPQVVSNTAYDFWVEAVRNPGPASSTNNFVDFNIRACWNGPGTGPNITLGTIVRLYVQ